MRNFKMLNFLQWHKINLSKHNSFKHVQYSKKIYAYNNLYTWFIFTKNLKFIYIGLFSLLKTNLKRLNRIRCDQSPLYTNNYMSSTAIDPFTQAKLHYPPQSPSTHHLQPRTPIIQPRALYTTKCVQQCKTELKNYTMECKTLRPDKNEQKKRSRVVAQHMHFHPTVWFFCYITTRVARLEYSAISHILFNRIMCIISINVTQFKIVCKIEQRTTKRRHRCRQTTKVVA